MDRDGISINVQRRIYAESMGRCMNPECQLELFINDGDIMEKAHIVPYCKTADNSYENLVVLCPSCHEKYDKLSLFSAEEVKSWKQLRNEEVKRFFCTKYKTFDELKEKVVPLLLENKTIYENYYLTDNKKLWDKFESKILINNKKLKLMFQRNQRLFQDYYEGYSNLEYIHKFIAHTNEFENTRTDNEKMRQILFPAEINSMFGIAPIKSSFVPSTESLECFIEKLSSQGVFEKIIIGDDEPYLQFKENGKSIKVYLNDTPRLRQLYFDYGCIRKTGVRLDSLNFALKYMTSQKIRYIFPKYNNLREVIVNGKKHIFIYKYCLSEIELLQLSPEEDSVVVNLHHWNGDSCISQSAHDLSKKLNVTLLTQKEFFRYIHEIK